MRRRSVLLFVPLALTACVAPQGDFGAEVRAIDGVLSYDSATEVVQVDLTRTAAELREIGSQLFTLTQKFKRTVRVVSGSIEATSSWEATGGGGAPQQFPPHLGWLKWLEGDAAIESARVHGSVATVQLHSGNQLDWISALIGRGNVDDPQPQVRLEADQGKAFAVAPAGEPAGDFVRIWEVIKSTEVLLNSAYVDDRKGSLEVAVVNRDAAADLVGRLMAADLTDPSKTNLRIKSGDGLSWHAPISELAELFFSPSGLVTALEATGCTVLSSAKDRCSLAVPDPNAARKFIDLLSSPEWIWGDMAISVKYAKSPNYSGLPVSKWQVLGPLWLEFVGHGFDYLLLSRGSGGKTERYFDIDFMPTKSQDLSQESQNQLIIDVLRRHDWPGKAQIEFSFDDHLIFWSTAKGKAQDAYNALHGRKQREPYGWAVDFLKRWDATATQ